MPTCHHLYFLTLSFATDRAVLDPLHNTVICQTLMIKGMIKEVVEDMIKGAIKVEN